MRLCNFFGNGKPKSAAASLGIARIICTHKGFENILREMGGNADPVIAEINYGCFIMNRQADENICTLWIIPHCVVRKILNETPKVAGVQHNVNTVLGNVEFIFKIRAFQLRHNLGAYLPQRFTDVRLGWF